MEHACWRAVLARLEPLHARHACREHLEGWRALALDRERAPELADLDAAIWSIARFRLQPCAGLLDARAFFSALAERKMPCTQYLRHPSHPEYTPEPDMVHEVVGHLSVLADPRVADAVQRFGMVAASADAHHLEELERLFWFSFEYGLVEEGGELRAFGAGLLSSIGELEHAFGKHVTIRPFDAAIAAASVYDTMSLQPVVFAAGSVDDLLDRVMDQLLTCGRRMRGVSALVQPDDRR